jgi:hypothetical protein
MMKTYQIELMKHSPFFQPWEPFTLDKIHQIEFISHFLSK